MNRRAGRHRLYFLADLHAISQPHVPAELRENTLEMTAALVACGIDPDKSVLFNQAQVPMHAELQWLLNGTARMGWLNRMTQWKDKAGKNREGAVGRAVHLSGAAGRRRAALSGEPRAGGRGPEAASGTGPRHRAEVQQRFRPKPRRSSPCPNRSSRPKPPGS
jgi:tryptophanyl-tRNA synthetase